MYRNGIGLRERKTKLDNAMIDAVPMAAIGITLATAVPLISGVILMRLALLIIEFLLSVILLLPPCYQWRR